MKKKSLAWTLFLFVLICAAPPEAEAVTQREALIALYDSTKGESWTNNYGWKSDTVPLCDWYGIYCPPDSNDVTSIDLNNNNLDGTIPPEIEYLTNLAQLGLTGNIKLNGIIPPEIGKLTNLANLFLFGNSLTGPIPQGIGKLPNLLTLNLADNLLTGNIPATFQELSANCFVEISRNCLTGGFENLSHVSTVIGENDQEASKCDSDNWFVIPLPENQGSVIFNL